MRMSQVKRMEAINKLIIKIGDIDRGFFNSKNGRAEFIELRTTVRFKDAYTQRIISIRDEGYVKGFNNGGTLLTLVRNFKHYIITGKTKGNSSLYSTHWGYSIEGMNEIIEFAKELGYIDKSNPTYKEYLIKLYNEDSCLLSDWLKEEIEDTLLNKEI